MRSKDFTRVAFQNCRQQPQYRTSKKATDGSLAMSAGMYDVLLYAEHGLYVPALEPKHRMHDRMCVMNKGIFTRLTYNTNDEKDTKWNQYGGTGITLNVDMRSRKLQDGVGGDPTKLGRWTWTKINGKDGIISVFVSAYRLCHNPDKMQSVWSQQVRCFKDNVDICVPDVHALFIRDLCKFLRAVLITVHLYFVSHGKGFSNNATENDGCVDAKVREQCFCFHF